MKKTMVLYALLVALVFGIASPISAKIITVQKGDSMWSIAQRYKVSFSEVLKLNSRYSNPNLIHPYDKITLPDGNTGTVTTVNSQDDEIHSSNKTAPVNGVSDMAEAILLLVNQERRKQGISELTLSNDISDIASLKSKDMAVNSYFDHTSPTYGTPFQMLQSYGIHYSAAGENIAAGQKTANEVMNSWMNSSGHRQNILNSKYKELGVGYYVGGKYKTYWTQMFVAR